MSGFEHATPLVTLLIVLLIGPVLPLIAKARREKELYVRRIPGIDAIEEGVGRAAEMGRPMIFSTGLTRVSPVLYACLGVLYYVGQRAATYKTRLFIPQIDPETMAIVEDHVRDAYRSVGRVSAFDPQSIIFLSEEQFAFASGYQGLVHREQVCTALLFGQFAAESLILAEAGQQVGAMQVAASFTPEQVPFFICTCDYTLIGEELFAASAYLSREPVQLGSLYAQDRAKLLFFVLIVVGVLIATWNSAFPEDVLWNVDFFISYSWSDFFGLFASAGGESP